MKNRYIWTEILSFQVLFYETLSCSNKVIIYTSAMSVKLYLCQLTMYNVFCDDRFLFVLKCSYWYLKNINPYVDT